MTTNLGGLFFVRGLYQASTTDMPACLATIKVSIALRVLSCFSSTLAICPKTIVVILAFSKLTPRSTKLWYGRQRFFLPYNDLQSSTIAGYMTT